MKIREWRLRPAASTRARDTANPLGLLAIPPAIMAAWTHRRRGTGPIRLSRHQGCIRPFRAPDGKRVAQAGAARLSRRIFFPLHLLTELRELPSYAPLALKQGEC